MPVQSFPKIADADLRLAFSIASELGDLPDVRPALDWPLVAFGWAYTLDCDDLDGVPVEHLEAHVATVRPYACPICGLCHRTKRQAKDCCNPDAGCEAWLEELDYYGRKGYGHDELVEILGLSTTKLHAAYELWHDALCEKMGWSHRQYRRYVQSHRDRRLSKKRRPKRKRRVYLDKEA